MLFPRGKGPELFDFSLFGGCGGKVKCGVQALFWTAAPNLMFPGLQPSRRELTPVRLCSVRLSWRQRARPSTTLHEIQICRSRLEYIVCITAGGRVATGDALTRKLYRPGARGWVYWTGNCSRDLVRERDVDEEIFEVCCEFLDERVPGGWVVWRRTDHIVRKGEEEERNHDDHVCSRNEQFQPNYIDSADDDSATDNAGCCS